MSTSETKVVRTMCPMSCHPTFCGMLAEVKDGKLVGTTGDKDNPDSYKVRRAKVGGYRDYFTDEQCEQLDAMVAELNPVFGYGASGS